MLTTCSNRTLLELKLINAIPKDIHCALFQSYLTGIEILKKRAKPGMVTLFQSYLTGIEINYIVSNIGEGETFQSYLTGIEMHDCCPESGYGVDVPIVPYWN